ALPLYTYPSLLNVYADAGGLPGTLLYQTTISVPDYGAPTPGGGLFFVTKDVESLEWDVTGDYWIGVESTAPDTLTGIRTLSDAGGGGCALQSAEYYGAWGHMGPDWGLPDDLAFYVEVDQCCIPFTGRVCAPAGDDWSTRSHDQARTGASQLAIGDAWCDLNMNWYSEDGDGAKTAQTMGPVIYDGRAYQVLETAAAGSSIRVYDLYTGSLVGTISGAALGNFAENDPLIVSDKLYIAGGDNRVVSRWDVSGAAVPGAPDWTATLPAAGGPLRRTNLLLVDVGGTLVLSGGTQLGRAFAINESDGLLYPGWATNPITLDAGQLVQGSATDGGQLYFGTRQAGLNGDLWTIDPATGAVNWKLSTAGGYQGATVYASITSEAFPQVSVDAGVLHVGGRPTGNFPTDGLYYRVDAGTGAVLSVTAANGILFSNPIIDINLVYLPTVTGWVSPAVHTNLMAYAKATGALVWSGQIPYEEGADNRVFNNGLLTCEPEPDADMIVYGDIRGTLSFVN
ncbi:MAG TPA: PQQ-binding-like beta-propeller repeat protein, partial [Candidatus Entotheonella sp.]